MEGNMSAGGPSVDASATRANPVWIDIENPPQVQYLLPLVRAFRRNSHDVLVTARDYGIAFDLLRQNRIDFYPVGQHFGASKFAKVVGNLRRSLVLRRYVSRVGRPRLVVSASRSAALAARSLGVPSFVVCDYEHVNLAVFRASGSYILYPDVISSDAFAARGFPRDRLLPFRGMKEDLSFADVDFAAEPPAEFSELTTHSLPRVLIRPPAEESHYHRKESSNVARSVLQHFSSRDDCVVIYSPRYEWQIESLWRNEWEVQPVVLRTAIPFVPLLKSVDVVVSGGGTMTREAAYLGVPAISIFHGTPAGVDAYLESLGRLIIIHELADLERLDVGSLPKSTPLCHQKDAAHELVSLIERFMASERV
jgi:predicted glycosyltransferase